MKFCFWVSIIVCVAIVLCTMCEASPISLLNKRTFSSYGKYDRNFGKISTEETTLLEVTGAGCVHTFWFAADFAGAEMTVFRFYVNGETSPSVEDLLMRRTYWTGDKRFGSTSENSFYFAIPIPFQTSIRITAQLSSRYTYPEPQLAYWTIRGVHDVPAIIGSYQLPPDAKLELVSKTKYLRALQQESFVNFNNKAGMLYHTEVNIKGKNLDFMEGPILVKIDGTEHVLATGMDDYFYSAWWMTKSEPTYALAGSVGVLDRGEGHLVAYRFHEKDPIVFTNSFQFEWQNGCAFANGAPIGKPVALRATFDFWIYTWNRDKASTSSSSSSTETHSSKQSSEQ